MPAHGVVVIGAGLAGLRAAVRLAGEGRDVVVLDASDRVGGRQRTDTVDGFRLDRGFQVLNPAYPAVRRWVDVEALDLHPFPVGVRVRRERTVVELWHPLRHPRRLSATLRSRMLRPHDLLALTRWAAPGVIAPRRLIHTAGRRDRTLRDAWNRAGLYGPIRREVLQPFLAGVIADDLGVTSDAFVQLLVRMFLLGAPGLPALGIEALPRQLERQAADARVSIRLGHRVTGVTGRTDAVDVAVAGADTVTARQVVVAVGPDAVHGLVDIPSPVTKGLQTWWFGTDEDAPTTALISIDGRRGGPIVNTAVMSRTVPSYAPPGRHLVEATCLLPHDAVPPAEADVRRHLAEIWGRDVETWELLRRDDIPHALPAQPPPLRPRRPVRLTDRILVCGDHRDTASVQGALVSGERAAVEALTTA